MKAPIDHIVIGSRGSKLALWQSEWVKAELARLYPALTVTIEIIKTTGDKILDTPLARIGDKGLFTKELEHALLDKRIDAAVHSMKDVPTQLPDGLEICAVTRREDVRDVFIAHPRKGYARFADIPEGGTIATGSLRRRCQIKAHRPDLNIAGIRGNLNTRFTRLEESDWDGMILARAGVVRLGFEERITETLPFETILPAVGQGALAIEIRAGEPRLRKLFHPLASEAAATAVGAERAFLRRLEGGCQVPIGAYGRLQEGELHLDGLIGRIDGSLTIRGKVHGAPGDADLLGTELAETLLASGGKDILEEIRSQPVQHVS